MRRILTLALIFGLTGCATLTGPDDGGVSVTATADGLRVRNRRPEAVYYAAIGENSLILFAPCVRPECPRVEAGDSRSLALASVPAGEESARIAFHWWVADREDGRRQPGPVHTVMVTR